MSGFDSGDLLLRGASLGLLVLLMAQLVLRPPVRFLELSFGALALSIFIYVIVSSPLPLVGEGVPGAVLPYLPVISPFLLWWAGQAFFNDMFRPALWHVLPATLVSLPVFAAWYWPQAAGLRSLAVIGLYGHLIYVAWATGPTDLVEERRRFRRWFILLTALFGITMELAEETGVVHALPGIFAPLQALVLLLLIAAITYWSLRLSGPVWQRRLAAPNPPQAVKSPFEKRLLDKLLAEMDAGIWRQEGLSVGGLAKILQAPEHQVRRAINGGLGYRNFAAFVNERRIDAACRLLANPKAAGRPILSVAFDVGFSSIGPFNRAFRQFRGESPSAYRLKAQQTSGRN